MVPWYEIHMPRKSRIDAPGALHHFPPLIFLKLVLFQSVKILRLRNKFHRNWQILFIILGSINIVGQDNYLEI